jgi:hypothetical protein
MRYSILLSLIFIYILLYKSESYDNLNEKLIFIELKDDIKKNNIKERVIKLTRERSIKIYNHLFKFNKIINEDETLKEYLYRIKFIKDNDLGLLIINKVNNYYNLDLNLDMNINNFNTIIKLKKLEELGYYFDKNILINRVILNLILSENVNKFDEYLINRLLELNLIKYDINNINKLLEDVNEKLKGYIYYKFNKEYNNLVILEINKIRNLVFIGEINI